MQTRFLSVTLLKTIVDFISCVDQPIGLRGDIFFSCKSSIFLKAFHEMKLERFDVIKCLFKCVSLVF